MFLERFTGVREPNISDWRRQAFGDMTSALRLATGGKTPPTLPDTSGPLKLAEYEATLLPAPQLPADEQKMPEQEKKR